ncbi:alkaline phosphatase D family protein [Pseudobacteriovorax antillogorgiicola]|uniref:Alkaline phosphatase D n=1 Tax=Pseudobacteriovorax antillogorgiicola TaxID=1513793 RepID=A0A1Y6CAM1_9BACT|nr:alkaline phosphatase D family protein [Pseudobacteriovorax antillogorgiicola]TCS49098.1 alkaline phosphatase D [Pseudobacteriovorax antillogorgiicola]SMF51756.1 alkaline phosphatase D [Pseudobacteriovorax antillogorgiicola]
MRDWKTPALCQKLFAGFTIVGLGTSVLADDVKEKANQLAALQNRDYHISVGSCAQESRDQPIWDQIAADQPDLFLFIGDNVYADTYDPAVMRKKYQALAKKKNFAKFRSDVPIMATWDDHDYGLNDAGSDYGMKEVSQQIFAEFWYPEESFLDKQKGIYHSKIFKWGRFDVQVLMLDTRYHRSPLKRSGNRYVPNHDAGATILGKAQWQWLETELRKPADVRIIASSIQYVAKDHRFEKWANIPADRQRMVDVLVKTKAKGVVFVSGDRHLAEISKWQPEGLDYPIYDLTASGLTNSVSAGVANEANVYRVPRTVAHRERNYGLIKIDDGPSPKLVLQIKNSRGAVLESQELAIPGIKPLI